MHTIAIRLKACGSGKKGLQPPRLDPTRISMSLGDHKKNQFPSLHALSLHNVHTNTKRQKLENSPPLDTGEGPLLFYTSDKDGASSAGTLLHDTDRNGPRSILSNFAKTPFELEYYGVKATYKTVENAFQSIKYLTMASKLEAEPLSAAYRNYALVIGQAKTPNRAFFLAQMRLVKDGSRPNFSTSDRTFLNSEDATAMKTAFEAGVRPPSFEALTSAERCTIMDLALGAKFAKNQAARNYLQGTRPRVLIEHTTRDPFWGDAGTGKDNESNNHLGKALMKLRASL